MIEEKTIEEIYEEMLAVFRRETGAEASAVSDLSVKLYALAAQVYGLYVQAGWLSRQCFPQSAEGEWLDRHAALRGLARLPAARAQGALRFSVDGPAGADLTVPAGTVCATAGLVRFETTEEATLPAGQTDLLVPAQAIEPGAAGNVPAGSILVMTVPPVGFSGCLNPQPFTGGLDGETDEALRTRLLETYRRMPNGANAAFYEQGALTFPEVRACTVLPRNRGRGTVDVVIATAAGLPGSELLDQVRTYFAERREIAVDVSVLAPKVKEVAVSLTLTPAAGVEGQRAKEAAEAALSAFFSGERLGKSVLLAQLNQLIFSLPEVANCALSAPAADVAVERDELPRLGTLTVEVTS